jgi:hypothetical protein
MQNMNLKNMSVIKTKSTMPLPGTLHSKITILAVEEEDFKRRDAYPVFFHAEKLKGAWILEHTPHSYRKKEFVMEGIQWLKKNILKIE